MERKKSNFIFTGFEKLNEVKPRKKVKKTKHRQPKIDDGTVKGKKIPLTGFVIDQINDTVRSNIKSYYRKYKAILAHEQKSDSIRVAEKLIEDNMNERLSEVIANAQSVKHTMSFKGWNITLLGNNVDDARLSITCIFKPNYVRRYNITIITEHDCYSIYSHQIACEKTIHFNNHNTENNGKQD